MKGEHVENNYGIILFAYPDQVSNNQWFFNHSIYQTKSRLLTSTRLFQIIFSLHILPAPQTQVHMAEHELFPTSGPCTHGIIIFLAIFLFAYLCLFVLGGCKPILAWQMPPYHALITGQVTVLCNISYFSARGYTLTLTHIHLGEAGYPKLTMDIFRCAFLKDQEQIWTAEVACPVACVCRGSPGP